MKKKNQLLFLPLLLIFLLNSCSNFEGEFAFKINNDEAYRRLSSPLEFSIEDTVNWVYRFNNKHRVPVTSVGIVIMKKEIIWVDILTGSQTVGDETVMVYGILPRLAPGEYKIVLTEAKKNNRLINDIYFVIYEIDDELY